jgi:hypothetical protein
VAQDFSPALQAELKFCSTSVNSLCLCEHECEESVCVQAELKFCCTCAVAQDFSPALCPRAELKFCSTGSPGVRVLTDAARQTCPNRVRHDVIAKQLGCLLPPQYSIEVPGLPESPAVPLRVPESGCLLPAPDERTQVGTLVQRLEQHVHVVGHEAVRKNRKVLLLRFTQKLRFDCGDSVRLRERHVPLERTCSNVVAGGADV